MKHIVSFSGGRTSAYLVHLMEQKRINEGWDVSYVFFDTGAEHPETYRFVQKCVDHFGIDLTCLRAKVNPEMGVGAVPVEVPIDSLKWDLSLWKEMSDKHGNPWIAGAYCTRFMKTDMMKKWQKQFNGDVTNWLGIRADEKRRLKPHKGIRYLAEISPMDKTDIIGWWACQPFDLAIQEHLGNCVFCIKKSIPKIALAIKDEPELAREWQEVIGSAPLKESQRERGFTKGAIYRNYQTIETISKTYEDVDRDELHMTMTHAKKFESGSCSESCEVFSDQMDLFDES